MSTHICLQVCSADQGLPLFEEGERITLFFTTKQGEIFAKGIHGDVQGRLWYATAQNEWRTITSDGLVSAMQHKMHGDWQVTIAPCFPTVVRKAVGDKVTVLGDWDGPTHHWLSGNQLWIGDDVVALSRLAQPRGRSA